MNREQSPLVALAAVTAGATAAILGAIELERRSLWIDEALDVTWSQLDWSEYLRLAFQQEASQALYLLVLKPWLAVASTDEWAARAPSVAFAAMAAGLLVVLGTRLLRSRLAGVGAGLLLATNSFVVSWSQQARQYALAMLLAVVVTLLFVHALESRGWRWWLTYGAVGGVAVYAHFFVALVLASHVPALAAAHPRMDVLRRFATAAGIAALLSLPALDFALNHDTGQVAWIPETSDAYLRAVLLEVSGESRLALVVGAVGLAALLAAAARRRVDAWRFVLVASWLTVPLALTLAISLVKPMLVDRYLIVAVPALALASAFVVSRLPRVAAVAALALLLAVSLAHVRDWYGSLVEQEWRGAVRYVERTRGPEDQLLVYPDWLSPPVAYYASSPPETDGPSAARAWIVTLADRAPEIERLAAESGYTAERVAFVSVDVWRFDRDPRVSQDP